MFDEVCWLMQSTTCRVYLIVVGESCSVWELDGVQGPTTHSMVNSSQEFIDLEMDAYRNNVIRVRLLFHAQLLQ